MNLCRGVEVQVAVCRLVAPSVSAGRARWCCRGVGGIGAAMVIWAGVLRRPC